MANFPPLKRYILFCIDRLIEQYHLSPAFLDVGCGIGDVSAHLASKGWNGKAIDISAPAIEMAKANLQKFSSIELKRQSLYDEKRTYKSIFAFDILEHLKEDEAALKKMSELLEPGGYVVIAVPSNPREWRWDDDYVEHVRRYTVTEMNGKLSKASLQPVACWDFTFPVFWLMRRAYTFVRNKPPKSEIKNHEKIEISGIIKMWHFPIISDLLSKESSVWDWIYKWQFKNFKGQPERGHEMLVLAKKG